MRNSGAQRRGSNRFQAKCVPLPSLHAQHRGSTACIASHALFWGTSMRCSSATPPPRPSCPIMTCRGEDKAPWVERDEDKAPRIEPKPRTLAPAHDLLGCRHHAGVPPSCRGAAIMPGCHPAVLIPEGCFCVNIKYQVRRDDVTPRALTHARLAHERTAKRVWYASPTEASPFRV
jgi:hypothetical protein